MTHRGATLWTLGLALGAVAVLLAGCATVPAVCFEEETTLTVVVDAEKGPVPLTYEHRACVGKRS